MFTCKRTFILSVNEAFRTPHQWNGNGNGMGARVRRNMEIGSTKDPIHILGTNEEINMLENRNTIKKIQTKQCT